MKSHRRDEANSTEAPMNKPWLKNTNVNMKSAIDVGTEVVRGTNDFLFVRVGSRTTITMILAAVMM
jgi:magnesium-transporting ATPase (P-type)